MPPKAQPKVLSLTIKTHKLSIIVTAAQVTSISTLKEEVLSALTSHPDKLLDDVPTVNSIEDFELCRALKEKGKPTGAYEVLSPAQKVKDDLVNWDTVYIQFRDDSGELQPVEVTLPALIDDEDELPPPIPESVVKKGKRKAADEENTVRWMGSRGFELQIHYGRWLVCTVSQARGVYGNRAAATLRPSSDSIL